MTWSATTACASRRTAHQRRLGSWDEWATAVTHGFSSKLSWTHYRTLTKVDDPAACADRRSQDSARGWCRIRPGVLQPPVVDALPCAAQGERPGSAGLLRDRGRARELVNAPPRTPGCSSCALSMASASSATAAARSVGSGTATSPFRRTLPTAASSPSSVVSSSPSATDRGPSTSDRVTRSIAACRSTSSFYTPISSPTGRDQSQPRRASRSRAAAAASRSCGRS